MGKHENLCRVYVKISVVVLILFTGFYDYSKGVTIPSSSVTISNFNYPLVKLRPFESRYIRVDLPPWFSSMSIALESDVDLVSAYSKSTNDAPEKVDKMSKARLPLVCFRDGSLPLPDFSKKAVNRSNLTSFSNETVRSIEGRENVEGCYSLQKQMMLTLTNEQITPGVWYVGVFNGIGAMRTQSKMISRGSAISYSANVSVEGCVIANIWGQFCNQSIKTLSCSESHSNGTSEIIASCRSSVRDSCLGNNDTIVYSLDVIGIPDYMSISLNTMDKSGKYSFMCYARYGAIALTSTYDYSGDLSKGPLVIPLPKTGIWYIRIVLLNTSEGLENVQNSDVAVCYSLDWEVSVCPFERAGFNCSSKLYTLQTMRQNPSLPFQSYFMPLDGNISSNPTKFSLERVLTNSSSDTASGISWTYFTFDIPPGAAGGNLHFKIISNQKVGCEIYIRYGGLPSADVCDYYYINPSNNSDGTTFFTLYKSSKNPVDFYILYAREGTWTFGLKHVNVTDNVSLKETEMSVSLERCPKGCSGHGSCLNFVDESGLTLYSYCSCDLRHGGIDCSIELVSEQGHRWQSISLVASNAAAILPAYWSLRKKAYPEWVIFTSSGISSALYHACDVGVWCALSFHVLQFMDFWLSFMAVVSTFVYMAAIDEASKRTIQAAVAILTALMAISGATRSANIWLVIVIGASGLLIGWLIEFSTKYGSLLFSSRLCLNSLYSWNTIRTSLQNVIKLLMERFHWGYMIGGFIALSMAAVGWNLETSQSYWIWHSIWHVSIYTSSFLFLCSNIMPSMTNTENQRQSSGNYELSRQDSVSHGV